MRRILDGQLAGWPTAEPISPLAAIARLRLARQVAKRVLERTTTASPDSPPPPLRELHGVLAEARRTVAMSGGSLYFVYLPDLLSVLGQRDRNTRYEVIAIARALELPVIDLTDDFQQHPAPLSLFPYEEGRHLITTRGLHYSRDGHRLVAGRVLHALQPDEQLSNTDHAISP